MDAEHAAGAAVAVGLLALFIRERLGRSLLQKQLAQAQRERDALREKASKREYRMERFEALWFPTVTLGPDGGAVSAAAGLPHCKACAVPLKLGAGEWACPGCGRKLPESLADTQVTDSVAKQALEWHRQRPAA
jgi:hypothetical protein